MRSAVCHATLTAFVVSGMIFGASCSRNAKLTTVFDPSQEQITPAPTSTPTPPPAPVVLDTTPVGGAQDAPPMPAEYEASTISNPGFEASPTAFTGWSANPCMSVDTTLAHSGQNSAKGACTTIVSALLKNYTHTGAESFVVRAWIKTDASFAGTFDIAVMDNSHGSGSLLLTTGRSGLKVGPGSDWVMIEKEFFPELRMHGTCTLSVRLQAYQTAGTFWADDFEIVPAWYPIRSFLKYPNYRGYLWSDKSQLITGVSEIAPPAGVNLADTTLTVKLDTTPKCASADAVTILQAAPASKTVHWVYDGSNLVRDDSGAWPYYVCSSLAGGGKTYAYPDWKIVKVSPSFRSALMNYFDEDNAWVHNGVRRLAFGTFERYASPRCSGCLYTDESSYITKIAGFGTVGAKATGSPKPDVPAVVETYKDNRFTVVMGGITSFSAVNFKSGSDQLTPWLKVADTYQFTHAQIMNNWYGSILSETSDVTQLPSTSGLSATPTSGGSLTDAYIHLAITGVGVNEAAQTLPSQPVTVAMQGNSAVEIAFPECPSERWHGYYLYAAGSASATPPAVSTFKRQGNALWIPCGQSFTLRSLKSTLLTTPTTDTTKEQWRPAWQGTAMTDQDAWKGLAQTMTGAGAAGAGAFYVIDEPLSVLYVPQVHYQWKTLSRNAYGVPTWGVLINSAGARIWRDVLDVPSNDPYPYGIPPSPDEYWAGTTTRQAISFSGTNNATASLANAHASRTDVWTDALSQDVYSSRPQWHPVQQYSCTTTKGLTYAEMRRQFYKALIGCQNWGSLGCGVLTWGFASVLGMERMVYIDGNTQAYTDSLQASQELMDIEHVWLSKTKDSAALGVGSVLSSVAHSLGTVCGGYANATKFPYGPVRFVTKDLGNGERWILASNLCGNATPYTVTFTLTNPATSVEVYAEGRSIPLAGGTQFTDSWADLDVHAYRIRE